jgi:hypothetical protein
MTRFITDFSTTRTTGAPALTTAPIKDNTKTTVPLLPVQPGRKEAYGRLQDMADRALRGRPGGLPLISDEDLKNTFPKPTAVRGLFKTYHKEAFATKEKEAEALASFNNLKTKLEEARLSMAELEKMPASAFTGKPDPDDPDTPAMDALKKAITRHNALRKALADYAKNTGGPTNPVLTAAHLACDRRVGEMISLAAQLQGRTAADLEGVMVADALRALAVEMHGGKDVLEQTAAKAEELFKKLNALDNDPEKLSPSFKAKARELDKGFKELEQKIQNELGKSEARPNKGRPVLLREAEVFKPLRQSLDQARTRLGTLAAPPPLNVDGMVDEIVGLAALDKLITKAETKLGAQSSAFNLLKPHLETFRNDLENLKNNLVGDIKNGQLGLSLDNRLRNYLDTLGNSRSLGYAYNALSNFGDATGQALRKDFEALVSPLFEAIYNNGLPLMAQEIGMVNDMHKVLSQGGGTKPWEREAFLKLAAESAFVSLPALVECSLRGIPAGQIEYRNVPESVLAPPQNLGSGAVNTVTLYQFKKEDDGRLELVFKPEHEAYHGFRSLAAHSLGYSTITRTVQFNTASSAVATAIGCGEVVVKASVGVQDGRFGLFMEKAPGRPAYDWGKYSGLDPQNPLYMITYKEEIRRQLADNGLLEIARANLQRELCRLEWADLLSGQVDRHHNNYLVDINPKTGEVKVTGIDNDASFGHNVLGPGLFKPPSTWLGPTTRDPKLGILVDASKLTHTGLEALRKNYGLNQFGLPEFIDKTTYDELMKLDDSSNGPYAEMLRQHLPDQEAVKSALSRLTKAKAYAGALNSQGRVVENWETHRTPGGNGILDHYNSRVQTEKRILSQEMASRKVGFYARDWASF